MKSLHRHIWKQNYGSKTLFLTKIEKFHKRYNFPFQAQLWPAITRQEIELESYSNPVKTREDLYLKMEKNVKIWTSGFCLMTSWVGYVLPLFLWRHRQSNEPILWFKLLLDS